MKQKVINLWWWAIYWGMATATIVSMYYLESFVGPDGNMKTPLRHIIPRFRSYLIPKGGES